MPGQALPPGPPRTQPWRALLALLVAGVCWLAFSPAPPAALDTGWDKLNHLLAFSTLAFTASQAYPGARRRPWMVALALLAFGVFIELVQTQIPSRSADVLDVCADSVGIAAGLLLHALWRRSRIAA